jgi:hypothetical protein
MAHYAFLDSDNKVVEVIVGKDDEGTNWEEYYSSVRGLTCKQTSYNTFGNTHALGGTPFRKNYAGVGYTYDYERDAFIPPKPIFTSWVLNEDTCLWEAPIPMPTDKAYRWNEETLSWKAVGAEE